MSHISHGLGSFAADIQARSSAEVIVEGSLMTALDTIGVLGNLIVCLVVSHKRNFQRVANIYVVALALSDILMATVCEPLSCVFLFKGQWTLGNTACRLQGCTSFFAAFFSLQTMTAMALNRYFRVVKPHLYRKLFSVRRTLISLLIIASTSLFGAGITMAVGLSDFNFDYSKSFCFINFPTPLGEKVFIVAMHLFYVSIPLSIVSVCYYQIFKVVRAHTKETFQRAISAGQEESCRRQRRRSASLNVEEVRISKVLFGTVLGFTICWTPIALIDLADVFFNHGLPIPRQVFLMYAVLGYGSSSINPFIYGIMNREFRRDVKNMFSIGRRTPRLFVSRTSRLQRHSNTVGCEPENKDDEAPV